MTDLTLSVSVVCVDQLRLEHNLNEIMDLGVKRLHLDLIDQTFGNLGLPPETLGDLRSRFTAPIDVHLMVKDPGQWVTKLAEKGADVICVHQQALSENLIGKLVDAQTAGAEIGLVLEPGELPNLRAIERIRPIRLTAMSVKPGGAGRPFEQSSLSSASSAARLVGQTSVRTVEADGAIGPKTISQLLQSGVSQVVLGSTVFPFRSTARNRIQHLIAAATHNLEGTLR